MAAQQHTMRRREAGLLLTFLAGLVGAAAFINVYSVQSILALLQEDFTATAVQVGATVGVTVLAMAVISPFVGIISDALGRKNIIVISVLLLSVPTGLIYFARSIEEIYAYRFFQGLVTPGIAVVMMSYISEEYSGKTMVRLMSSYITGTIFGGFLGRFFVGYVSGFVGWRETFLIMAAVNLVMSLLVFSLLPRSIYFVADKKFSHAMVVLWHHLRNKHLIAIYFIGAGVLFSLVGCFTYINLHLAAPPFNLSSFGLSNIFVVYLLGVVTTPLSGRIINYWGHRVTIVAALVLSCCGLYLTTLVNLPLVVIALAIVVAGIFIAQAAAVSYLGGVLDEGRSLGLGLYNMAYYGGGVLAAWVCGHAYMKYAWDGTVLVLIAAQLLALAVAWLCMEK